MGILTWIVRILLVAAFLVGAAALVWLLRLDMFTSCVIGLCAGFGGAYLASLIDF